MAAAGNPDRVMTLPFTHDAFLDVFGVYNGAMSPAVVALWLLAAAAVGLASAGRSVGRFVTVVLAVQWTWSAVAYHLLYFTGINPVAFAFAALFLVQAAFLTAAAWRRSVHLSPPTTLRAVAGAAIAVYSLAYPFLSAALVGDYPRIPTFGVPCPVTLLTIGLLLMSAPLRRGLLIVPVIWTAIGGSAALLLGVTTDFALPVAGVLALVFIAIDGHRTREVRHRAQTP